MKQLRDQLSPGFKDASYKLGVLQQKRKTSTARRTANQQ